MKMVNGGNFIGCFYVIWNLYMFLERRRKVMNENTKEIYQFLLWEANYEEGQKY